MRSDYFSRIGILIKKLLLLAVIYQFSRIIFYFINYQTFESFGFSSTVLAFFYGIRFDLSAIFLINIPIIFIYTISGNWYYNSAINKFINGFFYLLNIPFFLINCVDLEYFKFQGKRTTADFFQLFGMGDDMKNTIPQMAIDFWYVIVIFIILTILFIFYDRRIKIPQPTHKSNGLLKNIISAIFIAGFSVLLARGGFQYKPINIMSAARLTSPQMVPLVLNTPFTLIRTFGKTLIEEKHYMNDDQALKYFNKDHHFRSDQPFKSLNVVVIILESFSSEYIGAFNNGKGYTPFLDSLMNESITFSGAFANAKKSIDGIPAVVASMPALMSASYISTPYSSNKLHSIAAILGTKGYSSAFFHGGNNGTMNFDNFTLMTGFEKYYGRNEYTGSNKDYDGNWGIYDEKFYDFFIEKCNDAEKPFVNTFFSLSSHHPYSIPEHLTNTFPKGTQPIHESIGYADYALRHFFESAKRTSWYQNTLFVITADHTGPAETAKYNTKLGMFKIPILFYQPGMSVKGFNDRVTQQTDIIPGILDYLHFDEPFSAFGNSVFDSTSTPFAINYPGDLYQIASNDLLVQFDGNELISAYHYKTDTLLMNNILSLQDEEQGKMALILKSFIQQFNKALIKNNLTP